jgi:hypothetical protein
MFVNELFSKKKPEPAKPRNFVAKNAKMGGAGAHKDKKKADKQGDAKHKKDPAGDLAESNRGYEPGFASSSAPALGGKAGFKRAELQHELGHEQNNIAIAINSKTWKVIPGRGYADSKEEWSYLNNMKDWAAKKSASSGKKWSVHLTGAPVTVDEAKLPTQDKENRFKAIHQRDQQQDQLTSQAMNNINDTNEGVAEGINEFAPPGGDDDNDGFSDETLKRLAAQWYNGDEDPRVEKTLMAAGWEIGQDEGYDDEPGVFVVQAGDVNGNSYMSWPAHELQGVNEGKKRPDTYHIVNKDGKPANLASYADKESAVKDRDAKHQGAEVRQLGPRGKVKGVAEGGLEANTPDPVVVIQDLKGKILDKVNLSVAAQKYKLGNPQDIKKQLAHQNYTTIGNYVVVAPMSGQPQDATTQGVAEGMPADNDMGATPSGAKMTLGQWKQMWMKKMPNADFAAMFRSPPNMQGSAIAYFDGWMNNPDARWDPQQGVAEVAPPGAKAERMVKHIKKGYAKDGKITPKEKSIAYATAWKAHNKEINEEIEIRIIEMRMNGYEL